MAKPRSRVELNHVSAGTIALIIQSFLFRKHKGKHSGSAAQIAKEVLQQNSRAGFLAAGSGHFRLAMWTMDTALALVGGMKAIDRSSWCSWVRLMIRESAKNESVATCFTTQDSFEIPFMRVDNLPALIYMCEKLELIEENKESLQKFLQKYEFSYLETGLIDASKAGDWMDTIHRRSSSWANLWVLKMFKVAEKNGLKITSTAIRKFQNLLESKCWLPSGGFRDYQGTDELGVDASVLALYLGLFPKKHDKIIARLERAKFTDFCPMRAATQDYLVTAPELVPYSTRRTAKNYHGTTTWIHLGAMYIIGLVNAGYLEKARKYYLQLARLIERYKTVPETLNESGRLYAHILTSELGLTMGAGLFLELDYKMQTYL